MKELNVGTVYNKKLGHIYVIPEKKMDINSQLHNNLNNAISLEIPGNIAVIKTLPGFANSVAAIIDSREINEIAGTVAGNDTIIIVLKENIEKKQFIDVLQKEFNNIPEIIKP